MKKVITMLMILVFVFYAYPELINANPDPEGEPWYVGELKPLTPEQIARIEAIPQLELPTNPKDLPTRIDNSLKPFFRPVFNQEGGSCGQASGVGYVYTYEQNFERSVAATSSLNQYPTHYTYNFLNEGSGGQGSWHNEGWDIIEAGGCPNVYTYGGLWPTHLDEYMHKLWMNGYEKYESAMNNRIVEQVAIPVGTPKGLEVLKHWFNDHGDGSYAGGVAVFVAGVMWQPYSLDVLPPNSENSGQAVVTSWYTSYNHAMTMAGYNDYISWDYNGDGQFTNNIDWAGAYDPITGVDIPDGVVDMKDWEIGGVRMVNSWGTDWADNGKAWVMYRTLALSLEEGGIWSNTVYSVKTSEYNQPVIKAKATINYTNRDNIKILVGVSQDLGATEPDYEIDFPYFNYQGGEDTGMAGDGDELEIGLDMSPLLDHIVLNANAKYFLGIQQNGGAGKGNIISFSIEDNQDIEYQSLQTNVTIETGTTTYIAVDKLYAQRTIYVNNATGHDINNNGTSPENAYKTISKAIEIAVPNDIIKLAGTFTLLDDDGVIRTGKNSGLNITKSLTIIGDNPETTIIQAHNNINAATNRIFYIDGMINVILKNMSISKGKDEQGGGIYANTYDRTGGLTIDNCKITENFNHDEDDPTSPHSLIGSGGIFVAGGNLTITNTVISDNFNEYTGCGGIYYNPNSTRIKKFIIQNSSIVRNSSPLDCGGILLSNARDVAHEAYIENCTFSENTSGNGIGHAISIGTSMSSFAGENVMKTVINSCTIADNKIDNLTTPDNCGIYVVGSDDPLAVLDIRNSICANNGSENIYYDTPITFTRSYTICDDSSMPIDGLGNYNDTDPLLTTIRNEEGTSFYKLKAYSPAKDAITEEAGSGSFNGATLTDQRGFPVFNQNRDIGAYESPYYWIHQTADKQEYTTDPNHEINLHIADPIEFASDPTDNWKDFIHLETGSKFEFDNNSSVFFGSSESFYIFEGESEICVLSSTFENPNISKIVNGDIVFENNSIINIEENSTLGFQLSDVRLSSNTILDLRSSSRLEIQNGTNFIIPSGLNCAMGKDAEIIVLNKGRLETDNITYDPISFTSLNPKDTWNGIIAEVGSSVVLSNTNISDAICGLNASAANVNITNSSFTDCENGVSLVNCDKYVVDYNHFYGKAESIGTGVTLTYCGSPITGNFVSNFGIGVKLVSSTISLAKNTISNNINNGLYITGNGSKPTLTDVVSKDLTQRSLNNDIIDNGLNSIYYARSQIYMRYSAGIYMTNGYNNVYSGANGTLPVVPCIKGIFQPVIGEQYINKVIIAAEMNYWGYPTILDENWGYFFSFDYNPFGDDTGYSIDYDPYGLVPFTEGDQYPATNLSSNEPPSTESTLLSNAMRLEQDDKYTPSINLYEKVIEDYPDSEEYYVAFARLPYVYEEAAEPLDRLISTYDEAIASEAITNKKFFKEMKVSTKIKVKKYDEAIALAEEMKAEATTDEEKALSDIDIAIANMMKNAESKGKSRTDHSTNISDLLTKLTGESEEKASMDNGQLTVDNYELFQNYPNPFNPTTEIKFALPAASDVKLNVFNINGQLVSELVNGSKENGLYTVNFDASNFNSGMYFYTLEANGMSITKKMILTK